MDSHWSVLYFWCYYYFWLVFSRLTWRIAIEMFSHPLTTSFHCLLLPPSYNLMLDCWSFELEERPSFSEIVSRVREMMMMADSSRQLRKTLSPVQVRSITDTFCGDFFWNNYRVIRVLMQRELCIRSTSLRFSNLGHTNFSWTYWMFLCNIDIFRIVLWRSCGLNVQIHTCNLWSLGSYPDKKQVMSTLCGQILLFLAFLAAYWVLLWLEQSKIYLVWPYSTSSTHTPSTKHERV